MPDNIVRMSELIEILEDAISMKVPLKVDIEKGVNWLETKGL